MAYAANTFFAWRYTMSEPVIQILKIRQCTCDISGGARKHAVGFKDLRKEVGPKIAQKIRKAQVIVLKKYSPKSKVFTNNTSPVLCIFVQKNSSD